jgi:ketosteroid isomerase-like protein
MTDDNAKLVRRFYDHLEAGEFDQAAELFRDGQTLWAVPGKGRLAGDFEGRDAIRAALHRFHDGSYGSFRRDLHALCAADDNDHVYAQYLLRREHGGERSKVGVIDAWHVRDGRLAHVWTFFEDQYRFDAWTEGGQG